MATQGQHVALALVQKSTLHYSSSKIYIPGARHPRSSLEILMREITTGNFKPHVIHGGPWALATWNSHHYIATVGGPINDEALRRFRWALSVFAGRELAELTVVKKGIEHLKLPAMIELDAMICKYYESVLKDQELHERFERGQEPLTDYAQHKNVNEDELAQQLFDAELKQCVLRKFDKKFPFHHKRKIRDEQLSQHGRNKYQKKKKKLNKYQDLYHARRRYPQTFDGANSSVRDHFCAVNSHHKWKHSRSTGVSDENDKRILEGWRDIKGKDENEVAFDDLKEQVDLVFKGPPNWRLFRHKPFLKDFVNKHYKDFPLIDEAADLSDSVRKEKVFRVLQHCILFGCCPNHDSMALQHNQEDVRDFLRFCYQNSRPRKAPMSILDYAEWKVRDEDIRRCLAMLTGHAASELQRLSSLDRDTFLKIYAASFSHGNYNLLQHLISSHQRDQIEHSADADIERWIRGHRVMKLLDGDYRERLIRAVTTYTDIMRHCSPLLARNPAQKINDDFHVISRYLVCFGRFVRRFLPQGLKVPTPFSVDCVIALRDKPDDSSLRAANVKAQLKRASCAWKPSIFKAKKRIISEPIKKGGKITWKKTTKVHAEKEYADEIVKTLCQCFRELQQAVGASGRYPEQRRFCVFVDRNGGDFDKDNLIMFSPPNQINELESAEHMSEMSAECLIPMPNSPITTCTQDPALMTFSFHVESTQEIRLYLHWNGSSMRFYPQDIVKVLPTLFAEQRQNWDVRAERYVNGLSMIYDFGFEHFYRHLCQMDVHDFPSQLSGEYNRWHWAAYEKVDRVVSASLRILAPEVELPLEVHDIIRGHYCG